MLHEIWSINAVFAETFSVATCALSMLTTAAMLKVLVQGGLSL